MTWDQLFPPSRVIRMNADSTSVVCPGGLGAEQVSKFLIRSGPTSHRVKHPEFRQLHISHRDWLGHAFLNPELVVSL